MACPKCEKDTYINGSRNCFKCFKYCCKECIGFNGVCLDCNQRIEEQSKPAPQLQPNQPDAPSSTTAAKAATQFIIMHIEGYAPAQYKAIKEHLERMKISTCDDPWLNRITVHTHDIDDIYFVRDALALGRAAGAGNVEGK